MIASPFCISALEKDTILCTGDTSEAHQHRLGRRSPGKQRTIPTVEARRLAKSTVVGSTRLYMVEYRHGACDKGPLRSVCSAVGPVRSPNMIVSRIHSGPKGRHNYYLVPGIILLFDECFFLIFFVINNRNLHDLA